MPNNRILILKIIGVIQARINSKRLPGKVMLKIDEKPVIWHIFNRLKHCQTLDQVVISTGDKKNNHSIIDFAKKQNFPIYVGSEIDLIDRLYKTAEHFDSDAIVRITSDCPIVDPTIVDAVVSIFKSKNNEYDIVTNCQIITFPHGLEVEVYSKKILKFLWETIKEKEFREWFPLYIKKNIKEFKILNIKNNSDLSKIRLTLDYEEDLQLIKIIFKELSNVETFSLDDVLNLLKQKPELLQINSKFHDQRNIDAPKI